MDEEEDCSSISPGAVSEMVMSFLEYSKMYEEAGGGEDGAHTEPWFSISAEIECSLQDEEEQRQEGETKAPTPQAKERIVAHKPWSEFERLEKLLVLGGEIDENQLSEESVVGGNLDKSSEVLREFLSSIDPSSALLCDFLVPSVCSKNSASAVGFLLQSCNKDSIFVSRRGHHLLEMDLRRGETLAWRFSVENYSPKTSLDIVFSVDFDGSTVVHPTRCVTLEGSYTVPLSKTFLGSSSRVKMKWDNSYSRWTGKHLSLTVRTVDASTMQAAIDAADAIARKGEFSLSKAFSSSMRPCHHHRHDGRRHLIKDISVEPFWEALQGLELEEHEQQQQQQTPPKKRLSTYLYDAAAAAATLSGGSATAVPCATPQEELSSREDELALAEAKRVQAEAQSKVLLLKVREGESLLQSSRDSCKEFESLFASCQKDLQKTKAEKSALESSFELLAKDVTELETSLKKALEEKEFLTTEKNVWQVARAGIQSELSKVVNAYELEQQGHGETKRLLKKAQEAFHRLEVDNYHLKEEVDKSQQQRYRDQQQQQEEELQRNKEEDDSKNLEMLVSKLKKEKKLLVNEVKKVQKELVENSLKKSTEVEEARMAKQQAESLAQKMEKDLSFAHKFLAVMAIPFLLNLEEDGSSKLLTIVEKDSGEDVVKVLSRVLVCLRDIRFTGGYHEEKELDIAIKKLEKLIKRNMQQLG